MLALDCMQINTGEVTLRRTQLSSFVHNRHPLGLSFFLSLLLSAVSFLAVHRLLSMYCSYLIYYQNYLLPKVIASPNILFPSVFVLLVKSLLLLLLLLRPRDILLLPFKLNTKGEIETL